MEGNLHASSFWAEERRRSTPVMIPDQRNFKIPVRLIPILYQECIKLGSSWESCQVQTSSSVGWKTPQPLPQREGFEKQISAQVLIFVCHCEERSDAAILLLVFALQFRFWYLHNLREKQDCRVLTSFVLAKTAKD